MRERHPYRLIARLPIKGHSTAAWPWVYEIRHKVSLIIALLLAFGSPANAEIATEKNEEAARLAWAKAVSLAKERHSGNVCGAEAFQRAIIAELGVALRLSPYLKNEVVRGNSPSGKALQQALTGNLMLSSLTGKMATRKQVAKAMVGSVWYSRDGGAMGSLSILEIEKDHVRELVIDSDSDTYQRRPVIWSYSFDATTRKLALRRGKTIRHYKLELENIEYGLTNLDGGVGYSNEPDDCEA
jgi:hypothetical protein